MAYTEIISNEYLRLFYESDDIYIETFKKGFPADTLISLLSSHPEVMIKNFAAMKKSITMAPQSPQKIGMLKERITVEILDKGLTAMVTFNLPKEELVMTPQLQKEIIAKLSEKGVTFGVKAELFSSVLKGGHKYVAAEGIPPIDGIDSKITIYELKEAVPEIKSDGKVDFYELKLINIVKQGEWLGERLDPVPGKPGKSVLGHVINAYNGKMLPLEYDKNTVREEYANGKTVLYSRIGGAVNYNCGKISISNHIEIDGDVDFRTGNIKFDGYVTINGTIANGFQVDATMDIEIMSPFGIEHAKSIVSTKGSVFIKGGIASRFPVEIRAAKNIFTKYVENAMITCGDTVNIGYYSRNSIIKARQLVIESPNGHLIGGRVVAETRVSAAYIGSDSEKRTEIEVTGFSREALLLELENAHKTIIKLKAEQEKLKQAMLVYDANKSLTAHQQKERESLFDMFLKTKTDLKDLDILIKNLTGTLKIHGEGEICVTKKIFPNCALHIKGQKLEITVASSSCTYYLQDWELKSL
ncbi:MAG TPA: FapA family protein [Clostridia bacterium]